jgi:hypothetical protein
VRGQYSQFNGSIDLIDLPRNRCLTPKGIANLTSGGPDLGSRRSVPGLCRHLGTRLLLPDPEGFRASASVVAGCHEVSSWAEMAVDHAVRQKEALPLGRRLEALHLPLSSPGRPMRIFCAVVQIPARPVPDIGQDGAARDAVAAQIVGDDTSWLVAQPLQQPFEEARGRCGIAPVLDKNVEHDAVLVDGPPKVTKLTVDPDEHLIQVPGVSGLERRRRSRLANSGPNFLHQRRMLSWVTTIPRSAKISSMSRRLRLNT